jgi:predicted ATPase/DNA-binding XRE family transcriptional regulator
MPEMVERTNFGALLKRYRLAAGLSQQALAEQAGLSERAVSDLERGVNRAPRFATLGLLADALALTPPQRGLLQAAARPEIELSSAPPSNFPIPPTRLIGREPERARALAFLHDEEKRLLTLTGPSGVGKTRLALEILKDCVNDFQDGVWFIPLSPIREAGLVPGVIAQRMGMRGRDSVSSEARLLGDLQSKHALLALDNVEQILDCALLISALLAECPRVHILATSRTPLRVRGEQELLLAPLQIGDAIALFRERAKSRMTDREYPTGQVAAICERVDRLPLAIELAAMHVNVLSTDELRKRLENRLALLRGGPSDLPARHHSMEDAIAWSYELLPEPQRRCFRAMSVFAGGWTLEAAEAVCREDAQLSSGGCLLAMAALVDASLVQTELVADGSVRFQMLELVHEFAGERMRSAGEEENWRRMHAIYFARRAGAAAALFGRWLRVPDTALQLEFPNVRQALEWAEERSEAELGLELTGWTRLLYVVGAERETADWLERMLAVDLDARERGRRAAPPRLRIEGLVGLARVRLGNGQIENAAAAARQALELAESSGEEISICNAWATLGMIAQANGKPEEAAAAFEESSLHAARAGQADVQNHALIHLAELARVRSDFERASELLERALAMAQANQMQWDTGIIAALLGRIAFRQRDYTAATTRFRESLAILRGFGSPTYVAWCLEGYAAVLYEEGKPALAARLCAAASNLRLKADTPLPPSERPDLEGVVASARAALGEAAFAYEWSVGATLTQGQAMDAALSG